MSWWSPTPSGTSLATKGRSYDLNTGRIESTEEIYTHRMQIQRQQIPSAETHDDGESSAITEDTTPTDNTEATRTNE